MEISFKPAPLRSAQSWSLNGNMLTTPAGKTIDLSTVTEGQFSDLAVKRMWVSTLKLVTASDQVVVSCNDTRTGVQRQYYFALILEIVEALQVHNPTLQIQQGPGRAANIAFACVGLIPLGFGLKFIIDALNDGGDSLGFGIGLGLFFLLIAAVVIWGASPWKAPTSVTPSGLKAWLYNWLRGLGLSTALNLQPQEKR